ncbi:MAG: hypothetical protein A2167_08565 [Planctomycetes bacterium RBG_13_46_10]|nr:MAG: hypothetical protein A2167_08565 [Planctomycetes bacterium RBG_13_46_10]
MITASQRLKRLILAVLLYAIFPIAWATRPFLSESNISICIFRRLTGKPCPFCGLTRALACAMCGDLDLAFTYHPLWWLAVFIIITIGSVLLLDAVKGTDLVGFLGKFWRIPTWLIAGTLAILALLRFLLITSSP